MSDMKALVDAVTVVTSLPPRKREFSDVDATADSTTPSLPPASKRGRREAKSDMPREKRKEQNRLAAIESRRRKKIMVEELQRSVAFFTKANVGLKKQNAELERQILVAKQHMLGGEKQPLTAPSETSLAMDLIAPDQKGANVGYASNDLSALLKSSPGIDDQQAQLAHFAATQAMYKSMGFPPGAARAAASTFSQYVGQTGNVPSTTTKEKTEAGFATRDFSGLLKCPQSIDDQQAQAAHFAATQAIYKSMGFPPGAARAAASAFSQYAAQSGGVPDVKSSSLKDDSQKMFSGSSASADLLRSNPSGESYIEALNKFAMQQAAAANAAAAAASAAIQAAKYHSKYFSESSRSLPTFSGLTFPFLTPGSSFNVQFSPGQSGTSEERRG